MFSKVYGRLGWLVANAVCVALEPHHPLALLNAFVVGLLVDSIAHTAIEHYAKRYRHV